MKRIGLFIVALALALSPLAFLHPVRIQGESMVPTLRDGELHFALRAWCSSPPKPGQIWLVRTPEGDAVKRVLALPDQDLVLRRGEFQRDGHPLAEPYVQYPEPGEGGPWAAGKGYLVLGDNRPASRDSRAWGALPREAFESRVIK